MLRSNTTLVTAQEGPKMNTNTTRPGKTFKNNKNSMHVTAFFVMLCLCLLHNDSNAAVYKKRAIASTTESTTVPMKECHNNTPCGWAIYVPFTRRMEYFMKNTCICNPTLACLKSEDDLAVNAYVFRCMTRVTLTTTEITPTTTTYNDIYVISPT
ncbi:unnamed protein product [Macrosiphum euphorbiae]|uniref:Uncharacterized protein n=1 Tax=Macrosiphum euphorbiae TaxID=13131 RepID=A0AAV0W5B5_9HEMI|nr:unnamed protein product [Macrosiphum euphorbiae]